MLGPGTRLTATSLEDWRDRGMHGPTLRSRTGIRPGDSKEMQSSECQRPVRLRETDPAASTSRALLARR